MPTADIFQAEINHRREAKNNHEELQNFRVNRRGESAFQNIEQHDAGTDEQRDIVIPTEQRVEQFRQRVHGNAGSENRHHGECDGVKRADAFVKTHFQIFRNGTRLGAVIKWHHEHREKDHRRNCANPIKVRGADAVFCAARRHADEFERAEVCRYKRESRDPRWNRAGGRQKVRRRFHVARELPADADDKGNVGDQNEIVYLGEMDGLHRVWESF